MKKYIATILLLSILLFSGCMAKGSNEATTDSVSTTTETTTEKLNENKKIEASPSLGSPNGVLNRMLNASDNSIARES
jgi:PBP1b-binding outer membrane lipoprotein LpoB